MIIQPTSKDLLKKTPTTTALACPRFFCLQFDKTWQKTLTRYCPPVGWRRIVFSP